MIIVSQDKTKIVNFENIQNIKIESYGTHIKGKKTYKIFSGNFEGYETELGTYETEERAKEVLQEIVKTYVLTEQYKVEDERTRIKLMMEGILLYEMPED
jgi:hypothetical protein